MTKLVDRVIVSSNEHWLYLDFWPLVAYAYKTVFPGTKVTLVFLTERLETDPLVAELRTHGEVVLVRPVHDVTGAAQAKMARYWFAAQCHDEEVCYIDDIDQIPIDWRWHVSKVNQRLPGTMLMVGTEVYGEHADQCPASQMTSEAKVFRHLFGVPEFATFAAWIHSLPAYAKRSHADIRSNSQHEGMDCTTSQERLGAPLFSDEALIADLRQARPVPVTCVERGYQPGVDTIDRSWWASLDLAKLEAGGYLAAHTGRPYRSYQEGNDAIMRYLQKRYEGGPTPVSLARVTEAWADADMTFSAAFPREVYRFIGQVVPMGGCIFEFGSGKSTDYLSRYFWMISAESDKAKLNIYPSHYIYTPELESRTSEVSALQDGLVHPRFRDRPVQLVLINRLEGGASKEVAMACSTFRQPVVIVDTNTCAVRELAVEIATKTGRPVQWYGSFAVV